LFNFSLAKELGRQLDGWLDAANLSHGPARAIIAPYVLNNNFFCVTTVLKITLYNLSNERVCTK
jgi:hypothetical protein